MMTDRYSSENGEVLGLCISNKTQRAFSLVCRIRALRKWDTRYECSLEA
ncbi:hypothetical protein [Vibrio amylolyticus]